MKNFSQEVLPQWEKDLLEPKPPLIVPDSGIAARVNWLRANHKATNHKDAGSNFTSMMLLMKAMQVQLMHNVGGVSACVCLRRIGKLTLSLTLTLRV